IQRALAAYSFALVIFCLSSQTLGQSKFYAIEDFRFPKPDTIRNNDSTFYSFFPIVPSNQPSSYNVSYVVESKFGGSVDTAFASLTRISSQAYYTSLFGSEYYSTICFTPHKSGIYQVDMVLFDPGGGIRSDTEIFNIVVIDTIPGSYCHISPSFIDFGKGIPKSTVYKDFSIHCPYYSSGPFAITIDGPHDSVFKYFVGAADTRRYDPGQNDIFSLVASAVTPGKYYDTIFFYSKATQTQDTFKIPLEFEVVSSTGVMMGNDIPNKTTIEVRPNPSFNNATITLNLDKSSPILLEIYDELGTRRKIIANCFSQSGNNNFTCDTKDLPSGIYFVRLKARDQVTSEKIIIY
ncbi:MAG: T9SS type A sorting domain-containing protein, partial [Candidatus Kapaibacterium sp.]